MDQPYKWPVPLAASTSPVHDGGMWLSLGEAVSPTSTFALFDWAVLVAYLLAVLAIGFWAARLRRSSDDFFLAGRSMPMWAVAVSVLATSQSAATFVGGPEEAYTGNLTYLASNIGPLLAAIVVALLFLPAFYRHNVTSVYELIGHEMGGGAQRLASAMFMLGRVFASGARLYIVSIPFSLVAFGDVQPNHLVGSIMLVTVAAAIYSTAGGIRAVIWTDVMQVAVYLSCIALALLIVWSKIPLDLSSTIGALRDAEGGDKLIMLDFSFDLSQPYTVWASMIGITLLMIAAYGADQDLTQRMLTCRSARSAGASVITATIIGLPVVGLFLVMGLLLFVYNEHGGFAGNTDDSRQVFLRFILTDMPTGVKGLMMAGLFAAAMSSLDSALNSMSSTTVADFVRPWRARRAHHAAAGDRTERRIARGASIFWAVSIGLFACLCIIWHRSAQETLIAFALGVMTYAYAGLLGVFFTALLTKRGSARSAVAAMIAGFLIVLLLDGSSWSSLIAPVGELPIIGPAIDAAVNARATLLQQLHADDLAFAWRLTIAAAAATAVCCLGTRRTRTAHIRQ